MPAALDVEGLTAGYGETRIIEDIAFTLPTGGRLAVLGRNGMGKTTLLATLAGLTRRYAGTIRLAGQSMETAATAERARMGLGLVPQARWIFGSLTVEENLSVGLKSRPRGHVAEAYDLFPRLRERRSNLGSQLSGGEQQMLSVARTLLGKPSVLLLDEPLEGLAPVICNELMHALRGLAGEMSIVLVEQHIQTALDFAEDAIVLERGRIAWRGKSRDLAGDARTVDALLGVGAMV